MIKKEIVKQVIRDFHARKLPSLRPRSLRLPTDIKKIVTVTGVRRSGKTSMMFQTIKELNEKLPIENILYFNFEDERLVLETDELDLIIQGFLELYPDTELSECYFFFDEIQNVPGWERFVRRIDDTISRHIFITGSNSKLLGSEIATALRGRTVRYEVYPLSYSEALAFQDIPVDPYNSRTRALMVRALEDFLKFGGYPELLVHRDQLLRYKIAQEYFHVMIYRDLIERYTPGNLSALRYFIRRLLEGVGSPFSINKIYNDLKSAGYRIGKNTLYGYVEQLEAIYFIRLARKFDSSIVRRELAERKIYLIDNIFMNALTFHYSDDYGKLFENMIAMELCKKGQELFFVKGRRECDFILFNQSETPHPLQVSFDLSSKSTMKREVEGVLQACRLVRSDRGTIVTFDQEDEFVKDGVSVSVTPAWKFLTAL